MLYIIESVVLNYYDGCAQKRCIWQLYSMAIGYKDVYVGIVKPSLMDMSCKHYNRSLMGHWTCYSF